MIGDAEPAEAVAADLTAGIGALPAGLGREELVAAVAAALDASVGHGATAVVALSGGPDSSALAHLVAEARPDLRLVVGHVRHGLRDDAADAGAAAAHAAALGLAYHERRVSVRRQGEGLEAAARRARYRALVGIAAEVGADAVLVGHTADDQAETLLLNLARGSGVRGLAGMAPLRRERRGGRSVQVVRPLLRLRRRDVRAFVAGEGLAVVSDPTNADRDQRRARARYDVLPALTGLTGGPGDPVGALTRLADLARDDADALDALADRHARRLLVRWGPVRAVRVDDLAALPRALAT
ncbi:MAG TPA: tRNA lysidine(34) synthetase TilS, partial [Egibacteraceae bacterium]